MAGLMSLPALAAQESRHFRLYQDVMVNGTKVPAGRYTVKFDNTAQNSQVEFMRGDKTIATAPAHVKQVANEFHRDTIVLKKSGGNQDLDQIRFSGTKTELVIGSNSMTAGG